LVRCHAAATASCHCAFASFRRFRSVVRETRCETYYLQRTRFESIAEHKLRRRQLTEDGNVEISGRDLR
jgi:hypothetical protein